MYRKEEQYELVYIITSFLSTKKTNNYKIFDVMKHASFRAVLYELIIIIIDTNTTYSCWTHGIHSAHTGRLSRIPIQSSWKRSFLTQKYLFAQSIYIKTSLIATRIT